jgi:hypothetical protein
VPTAQIIPDHPGSQARGGHASPAGRLRAAYALSAATGVLMAAQSAAGMLFFGLYRDQQFALDAWRVNDPVTFFVAVPLVFTSLALAVRGSLRGLLVLLGVMQYALYNYAYYLFGAALNVHFLLYVALFVVSGLTLIAGLSGLDVSAIRKSFSPRTPVRLVAAYMGFWAVALGVAWIGQSLLFTFTGQLPELGEGPFRLIAALDLSLVVTPVAIGAKWLWARRDWGFIIAVVLNTKGTIYAALLSIASLAGGPVAEGGGDGLFALWLVFTLGSLGSLAVLLVNMRSAEQ